jgi:uridine kinase
LLSLNSRKLDRTLIAPDRLPYRRYSNNSLVIGISGGSGAGKSWLTSKFEQLCPLDTCVFDLDGYYREIDFVNALEYTHDNPQAINFDEALVHLDRLVTGLPVAVPIYDFASHTRTGSRICQPAPIIIVEGIFAFSHPLLLKRFNLKVWVEAADSTRYKRRLERDVAIRGRDVIEVTQRYERHARPGYERFIHPNLAMADIVINNDARSDAIPEGLYLLLAYALLDFQS